MLLLYELYGLFAVREAIFVFHSSIFFIHSDGIISVFLNAQISIQYRKALNIICVKNFYQHLFFFSI